MAAWRLAALALAIMCLWAALALIIRAGLPERQAAYAGFVIDGTPSAPEMGAIAPDFSAFLLNGETLRLSSIRPKPVILNFWATWCQPCEVEMQELERLRVEQPAVKIIAVNVGETPAAIASWTARLQLALDIALDPEMRIASLYQLRGQPMTFIIDGEGIIRAIFFGATNAETLSQTVEPYL